MYTFEIDIFKYSDVSGKGLSGEVFGLYYYLGCTQAVSWNGEGYTDESDEDGPVMFYGLSDGTYYIKELAVPDGYILGNEVYEVTLSTDLEGYVSRLEIANTPAEAVSGEAKEPGDTEIPAETEEPEPTDTPAETEEPDETETLTETEEPDQTESPAGTEGPMTSAPPTETEEPAPSETPDGTEEPDETESPVAVGGTDNTSTPSWGSSMGGSSGSTVGDTLPQTGMILWPVIVLGIAGAGMIAAGFIFRRKHGEA